MTSFFRLKKNFLNENYLPKPFKILDSFILTKLIKMIITKLLNGTRVN